MTVNTEPGIDVAKDWLDISNQGRLRIKNNQQAIKSYLKQL